MISNLLKALPPIKDKSGWPWNQEVDPNIYSDEKLWPKISIVTPSFNQGQFIEETIRSILLQNYPNIEYIIIDGGSTDNTVAVLKKYNSWITYWISEGDKGQADAINKGVSKSTGEIFNWINSDDILTQGALFKIASLYTKGVTIAGKVSNFFDGEEGLGYDIQNSSLEFEAFLGMKSIFHQPGIWCYREDFVKAGPLPIQYSFYFDRIFLIGYFFLNKNVIYTDAILVSFRLHNLSKTQSIMLSKDVELIEWYRLMEKDSTMKNYLAIIRRTLYGYLITASYTSRWALEANQYSALKKTITYLSILLKHPRAAFSRYYYTIYKKNVIDKF